MYLIIWSLFIRVTYSRLYEKHSLFPQPQFFGMVYPIRLPTILESCIPPPPPRCITFHRPTFSYSIFWMYLSPPNIGRYINILKIHIPPPFSGMDIRTPPLIPSTPPSMFGLGYTQFQHLVRLRLLSLLLTSVTHPSPYTFLRWSETN